MTGRPSRPLDGAGRRAAEERLHVAEADQVAGPDRDLAAHPPAVDPGAVGRLQVGQQPAVLVRSSGACRRETVMSAIARSQLASRPMLNCSPLPRGNCSGRGGCRSAGARRPAVTTGSARRRAGRRVLGPVPRSRGRLAARGLDRCPGTAGHRAAGCARRPAGTAARGGSLGRSASSGGSSACCLASSTAFIRYRNVSCDRPPGDELVLEPGRHLVPFGVRGAHRRAPAAPPAAAGSRPQNLP